MSYAIDLLPEALSLIKSFDPSLAEQILDEIDRIADDPKVIDLRRAYPFVGFEYKYAFRLSNRIVTLFLRLSDQTQTLYVQTISVQGD